MAGQLVQFPISLGVDEGTNPKALQPGRLKSAINVQFDKNARLAKRFGTRNVGSAVGSARRLVVRGDELSVITSAANTVEPAKLRTYSPTKNEWSHVDDVHDVGLMWTTLVDDHRGVRSSDFGTTTFPGQTTKLVHAWVTGEPTLASRRGTIWFQILDTTNDAVVVPPTPLDPGVTASALVRVVVLEFFAFIFWTQDSGVLTYASIDLSTYSVVTTANLITGLFTHLGFDAAAVGSNQIVVSVEMSTPRLELRLYGHSNGIIGAPLDTEVVDSVNSDIRVIAVTASATTAWVAYAKRAGTDQVLARGYDIPGGGTLVANGPGPSTLDANCTADQVSVQWRTDTEAVVAWSGVPSTGFPPMSTISTRVDTLGVPVPSTKQTASAMYLASRLFRWQVNPANPADGNRIFAFVRSEQNTASFRSPNLCSYLLEYVSGPTNATGIPLRYVGKVDDGIAGAPVLGSLPSVVRVGPYELRVSLFYMATAAQRATMWRCGLRQVSVTFRDALPIDFWRSTTIGQETYLSTGVLSAWDGRVCFDSGMREPSLGFVQSAAGAGAIANGTYIYQALVSYRSFAGVYHRGPPTTQRTVVVADPTVNMPFMTHQIDGKQDLDTGFGLEGAGVIYEIYRSVVNASTPQRLTYEPIYNVAFNNPQTASFTFVDTRADADITGGGEPGSVALATRPVIYTTTGELEDVQPVASTTHTFHLGRMFLITGGKREVWWSKDIDENPSFAPGFHPTQRFIFETDLTALWPIDDKLIISSDSSLWYVVGDGPNVSGEDNRFATPRLIQTDVGCTNPRSVVGIPNGTIFEGRRGLYLLTRALEVIEFGDRVRDTLAAFPVITSAVLVATLNEARFTCNSADGLSGRVVVYDYLRKEWLVRDYGTAIVDAVMHDGAWTYVTPAGQVVKEDTTTHLAAGTTFVPSTVTFAPISMGGAVSWSRVKEVYAIGQSVSNHALSVSVTRDFGTAPMQTRTFEAGSPVTTIGPLEKAMLDLKTQKVQAVEVTISDAAPADTITYPLGNGGGFVLEGLAFLIQPKAGLPREAEGRRG